MKKVILVLLIGLISLVVKADLEIKLVPFKIKKDQPRKALNQLNSSNESRIKSCLSYIYSAQVSYQQVNGVFTDDQSQLNFENSPNCKGMTFKTEVGEGEFVTTIQSNKVSWSIDSDKRIEKNNIN